MAALGGDGVVTDNGVGHTQDGGAVGQVGDGFAHDGDVGAAQNRSAVGGAGVDKTFVVPGGVVAQHVQEGGQGLLPIGFRGQGAIHGAAGHGLDHEGVAGSDHGVGGQGEDLAGAGDRGPVEDRSPRVVLGAGDVGECDAALGSVEGGAALITREELCQGVPAGGHDHEGVFPGGVGQFLGGDAAAQEGTAALVEQTHPGGHLDAVVDRLGGFFRATGPGEVGVGASRVAHTHAHTLDGGGPIVPEGEAVAAFAAQCGTEEALGRPHATGEDLLGPGEGES